MAHFVEVLAQSPLCLRRRRRGEPRPAADAQHIEHIAELRLGAARLDWLAGQQAGERHLPGRHLCLEQRHRPLPRPRDATSARMTHDFVRRQRRSGQQELARLSRVIAGVAGMVPHARRKLPFIEQPRAFAIEHRFGTDRRKAARRGVGVEAHHASRMPQARPRLAATLGALNEHCSHRAQLLRDQAVDDPRSVAGGRQRFSPAARRGWHHRN